MLVARETEITSILVELGDPQAWWAACDHETNMANLSYCYGTPRHPRRSPDRLLRHPRGGDVDDLHLLQRQLRYDVYRVNIHVNREVFTWRGENANARMSPQQAHWEPLYGVRAMRKLERLRDDTPRDARWTLVPRNRTVVPPSTGPARGSMRYEAASSYSKVREPAYCCSFCVTSTRTIPSLVLPGALHSSCCVP